MISIRSCWYDWFEICYEYSRLESVMNSSLDNVWDVLSCSYDLYPGITPLLQTTTESSSLELHLVALRVDLFLAVLGRFQNSPVLKFAMEYITFLELSVHYMAFFAYFWTVGNLQEMPTLFQNWF